MIRVMMMMMLTYISPLLDLDLGDVLDGDLEPVPVPHPGIHDAEPTLAKDRTHLRQSSNREEMEEGRGWRKEKNYDVFFARMTKKIVLPCKVFQTVPSRGGTWWLSELGLSCKK